MATHVDHGGEDAPLRISGSFGRPPLHARTVAAVSTRPMVTNSAVKEKYATMAPPRRAAAPAIRCVPPDQIDQCLAEECSMASVNSESQAGSISPVASPAMTCAAKSCHRFCTKMYEMSQHADPRNPSTRNVLTCC